MARVAYLTWHDPRDVRYWSGVHSFMFQALSDRVEKVVPIGQFHTPPYYRALELLFNAWHSRPAARDRRKYRLGYSWFAAFAYGRAARPRIAASGCDIVFAPISAREALFSSGGRPIVYLNDAIFPQVASFYPKFGDYAHLTYREAEGVERACIRRAAATVLSSQWAAEGARRRYGTPDDRLHVIPFGANLRAVPPADIARPDIRSECRVLLVGKHWHRKGADIAVEAVALARQRGHAITLTILGPREEIPDAPPWLRVIPPISKAEPGSRSTYDQLFYDSHVFILPSRADCSPIVLNEAAAFGLPALASGVGGIREIVDHGVTGFVHGEDSTPADYAASLVRLLETPGLYDGMRVASRRRYEETLNWSAWADRMSALFDTILRPS